MGRDVPRFLPTPDGLPSFHDIAKGWESLLLSDKSLALASSLVRLDFVGAVGIELKAVLKMRKLLIPLNGKNGKNSEFAQVRYMAGTRTRSRVNAFSL